MSRIKRLESNHAVDTVSLQPKKRLSFGRYGAECLYDVRNHKISIFILQTHGPEAKAVSNHDLSFTVTTWRQGGLQCYMVTDASQEEAGKLVAMFQEANRS